MISSTSDWMMGKLRTPTGVRTPSAIVFGTSDSMRFPAATPRAQSSAPLGSTEVHGTRISVEKVSLSTLK